MHITDIIKKPVINTEKARNLLENNEYVFIVDRRANKLQIKDSECQCIRQPLSKKQLLN